MEKSKNKLYTKSYLMKRLRDSGLFVVPLDINYSKADIRYWTILIEPRSHNILVTCFKNDDDFYFKLYSNKNTMTIHTLSVPVLINNIRNLIEDINNSD